MIRLAISIAGILAVIGLVVVLIVLGLVVGWLLADLAELLEAVWR